MVWCNTYSPDDNHIEKINIITHIIQGQRSIRHITHVTSLWHVMERSLDSWIAKFGCFLLNVLSMASIKKQLSVS